MFNFPGLQVALGSIRNNVHAPAAATAAVVTLAAVEGYRYVVNNIQWSYSEAPTGGRLFVTSGGVTIFDVAAPAAGPGGFNLLLKSINPNEAMVITLASGGGTAVGRLNVQSCLLPQ